MAVAMLSKPKKMKLPRLGPNLSEAEAREIYRRGEEATVFALLELAQHWGGSEQPPPATPSAMIPTFQKPTAKRGKLPGRRPGHAGVPRAERPKPTVFQERRANVCPDCGGPLTRCRQTRSRETVDIPAGIHVETTQHTLHLLRDLKHVEQYKQPSRHWPPFARKLRRLLGDAIRLKKNDELDDESYASRRTRILARLDELILVPWEDPQASRLIKRLRRTAMTCSRSWTTTTFPLTTVTRSDRFARQWSCEKTNMATAARPAPKRKPC